jgi:hypothetical protein
MPAAGASRVDAILARFPGPVTLYPSRLRLIGLLAVGLAFVAVSIVVLHEEADGGALARWLVAWFALIFFGVCALAAAVMLLPGAASLTLAADGFEVCSLFRRNRTPWRQASDFIVGEFRAGRLQRLVAYDDAGLAGIAAETSRSLVGRNAAFPDTYGLSHEELADLMRRWSERARSEH